MAFRMGIGVGVEGKKRFYIVNGDCWVTNNMCEVDWRDPPYYLCVGTEKKLTVPCFLSCAT